MEWRIVETSRGFHAQYGSYIEPGTEVGYKPGVFMPGFIVSESARCDTRKEAEEYIKERKNRT